MHTKDNEKKTKMDRDFMLAAMMGGRHGGTDGRESTAMLLKSIVDIKETSRLTKIPASVFDPTTFKPVPLRDEKK